MTTPAIGAVTAFFAAADAAIERGGAVAVAGDRGGGRGGVGRVGGRLGKG